MYFLIPYFIMKYEHIKEEDALKSISKECEKLYRGMTDARDAGLLNEYDISNIMDLTSKLANYLFEKNQKVKREVNAVMGGEVLETYADRMIAKGERKGRIEGELEGERRGRIKGELEGERRGKVAILHELNFTTEKIAEKLSLSVEQVKEILQQL